HAVVADEDGDGRVVDAHLDLDRVAVAVLDRVDQQVAHDAVHPARVDVGGGGPAGAGEGDGGAAAFGQRGHELDGVGDDVVQVTLLHVEQCRAGVETADLQQVGEHLLEPVQLGVQELGRAAYGRVEVLAVGVQHLAGHPDGGERGAQLVGDVGDEALL